MGSNSYDRLKTEDENIHIDEVLWNTQLITTYRVKLGLTGNVMAFP